PFSEDPLLHKRVVVWVQHFADRPHLMLQWHDPATGKRKSRSAGTNNPLAAEEARADLEYELNHGLHQEASQMSWERFRELFEAEHVAATRENTRENYRAAPCPRARPPPAPPASPRPPAPPPPPRRRGPGPPPRPAARGRTATTPTRSASDSSSSRRRCPGRSSKGFCPPCRRSRS